MSREYHGERRRHCLTKREHGGLNYTAWAIVKQMGKMGRELFDEAASR